MWRTPPSTAPLALSLGEGRAAAGHQPEGEGRPPLKSITWARRGGKGGARRGRGGLGEEGEGRVRRGRGGLGEEEEVVGY